MKAIGNDQVVIFSGIPVKDGSIFRSRDIKAAALPMAAAIEWLDKAREIEAMIESEAMDAMALVLDFVCEYNEHWPVDDIKANATGPQVMGAFEILKDMNDPLAERRKRREEREMAGVRLMEKMGDKIDLSALIEKHSSKASAESANGSALTPTPS